MIYWYLFAGFIAGALWYLTGGRLGFPREESLVAFFRRQAERSPALPKSLPQGLERGRDDLPRASKVRAELRWRRVPVGGAHVQLWQAWRGGRELPPASQILLTPNAVLGGNGPAFAVIGDWTPYRSELRDRWVLFESIVQREPEKAAGTAAVEAARRALNGTLSTTDVKALAAGAEGSSDA